MSTQSDFLTIVQTVILAQAASRQPGRRIDIRSDIQAVIADAVDASHRVPARMGPAEAAAEYLEAMVYEDGKAEPPKWLNQGYRSLR